MNMDAKKVRLENLKGLIAEYKTAANIEKLTHVSAAYISQILNKVPLPSGNPRGIGDKMARALEQGLGKPHGWMDVSHETNVTPIDVKSGEVPLISWVAAGNWCGIDDPFPPGEADTWLPCPVKHGPNTFALRVSGLSMYNPSGRPSFYDGDIIYVDPSITPVNKSLVVIRLEDSKEATFKQLIIETWKKYLVPINPDWPEKFIEVTEEATICGVVIGKWVEL